MLSLLLALAQAVTPAASPTPTEIVAAAPASEWVAIAPEDLLVMDLAPDARGRARRVVIQLMPPPFSQGWVGNIRMLARARWWDGTSVNRVQDNYVAQWGDATEKKALPAGLTTIPENDYSVSFNGYLAAAGATRKDWADRKFPTTVELDDPYAGLTSFWRGFPVAFASRSNDPVWPVHCYGAVGVGRNLSPDTGSGAELYAVIGHAPRHLDRNIAVVGRVVEGIEHLSSLPRGTGALGFYETADERVPIVSMRLASDLPAAERPRLEYLSTESKSFARYSEARANRHDAFFIRPAGGVDVCNVPVSVRRVK